MLQSHSRKEHSIRHRLRIHNTTRKPFFEIRFLVLARIPFRMWKYPPFSQSHSQSLRSPWPVVRKRELWEQPFQACAIDADCMVKPDGQNHQNSVISKWWLPELSFSDRWSRGMKTLGTRLPFPRCLPARHACAHPPYRFVMSQCHTCGLRAGSGYEIRLP